ncbi:MAG: hypothetical protein IKI64_05435 [Clostridia bacterium]|nr:hypothetical protein [Clostridia bacterium]
MKRINESKAAEAFVEKLKAGVYPIERAKNTGVDYCAEKEARDTAAVREFTKSKLFATLNNIKNES